MTRSLPRSLRLVWSLCALAVVCQLAAVAPAAPPRKARPAPAAAPAPATKPAEAKPVRVYVPYKELQDVFQKEGQGVFLPYTEFDRLWRAARGKPAPVDKAPQPYVISTARFTGSVSSSLATMRLELTVDLLAEGWTEVPIGLSDVAVSGASFAGAAAKGQSAPLLRVVKGQYVLLARGPGRRVLQIDFVRRLVAKPGLNVLEFRTPPAAVATLELTIPEENMKVDVEPMLAATTSQADRAGKKATVLQAFLGSARSVKLSWKPKTQAAAELEPVIVCEQLQHVHVDEALVRHETRLNYEIRRRGVDSFAIQLPAGFRVTKVDGANIARWDIQTPPKGAKPSAPPVLQVKLFSPVKDRYTLTVQAERFLKEASAELPLEPVLTRQVLRRTGLLALTHAPRRSVALRDAKGLARVDTGRLPKQVRSMPGATAYRFLTGEYGGTLAIGTVAPRVTVQQLWALGVGAEALDLRGRLDYSVERAGVFQVAMDLPAGWEVVSVGPSSLVDEHELAPAPAGKPRKLTILLKQERMGSFQLQLTCRRPRTSPEQPVSFELPTADAANRTLYSGQLVVYLAGRFRAEIDTLKQFQPLPLNQAAGWTSFRNMAPAMAFQFRQPDAKQPASAGLRIAVRPAQVSAVVHRRVDIQPGWVDQDAIVEYRVLYAPVDTFYLKMPRALADMGVQIDGPDIKERPRLDRLPPGALPEPATQPAAKAPKPADKTDWVYYKIVLQSPVIGTYRLTVTGTRQTRQSATRAGQRNVIDVAPIYAAGTLASQSGHIAVAKADTLAIGKPKTTNLVEGDPASEIDVPQTSHRQGAVLAFKYTAPPFALQLPVVVQAEAAVLTTIADAAVVEQVLGRDGRLTARAVFVLTTRRGRRLPLTLPEGAKLFSVLLNGTEAPVEPGASPRQWVLRLPPSAGAAAHLVLEISYGQDSASPASLQAPDLGKDVPVQRTLWLVWVAGEDVLLGHDPAFARSSRYAADRLLKSLKESARLPVKFQLEPQGKGWYFMREGAPGVLSLRLADRETFHVAVWAGVLILGVLLLKCGGFCRAVVVLLAAAAAGCLYLWQPLLVRAGARAGIPAAAIVLALWAAHWLLVKLRRRPPTSRQAAPADPPPPPGAGADTPPPPTGDDTSELPHANPRRPATPADVLDASAPAPAKADNQDPARPIQPGKDEDN